MRKHNYPAARYCFLQGLTFLPPFVTIKEESSECYSVAKMGHKFVAQEFHYNPIINKCAALHAPVETLQMGSHSFASANSRNPLSRFIVPEDHHRVGREEN